MHQTSEGHVDSTRFSSFPQVDLSPLARLSRSSHAALTEQCEADPSKIGDWRDGA
jgi:hypothetical protein